MIWPFKRKPEHDWKKEQLDLLKDFRDVGEKFTYLGKEMLVVSHVDHDFSRSLEFISLPRLVCHYFDATGTLKHARFTCADLPVLRSENGESPVEVINIHNPNYQPPKPFNGMGYK